MLRYTCALVCALLVISLFEPAIARKGFSSSGGRHSYPKSGGLSGGGSHGYPSSGGLSGGGHGYPSSGGSHGYPSSGGLSGGGHGYPSSGGSHGYPSSGGSHGSPPSGSNHGYPSGGLSGGSSGYPQNHHTNTHSYPANKGLSGNSNSHGSGATTNVHHHYHYSPPQQIRYTPAHGGAPVSYPVYRGTPPTYVYQYKDSGSKYGTLLAGLALLNLGTLAGAAYASSHSHSNSNYKQQPGEVCKFAIKKDNGDYEETKIECQLISSYIFAEQSKHQNSPTTANVTSVTVTNVTTVNTTNAVQPSDSVTVTGPNYTLLPNGTLVPLNATTNNTTAVNATSTAQANNTVTSSVMVTTTNTTTVNALDVKGNPIQVTPGMHCYVIRHSPVHSFRKEVSCGLLQAYAEQSIKRNSAIRNLPTFTILMAAVASFVLY